MSEDIKKKIYEIIEKYENPVNNKSFNAKDKIFNIILKQGNLNISLEINPSEAQKYDLLVDKIKDELKQIEGIVSVNFVLTSESLSNQNNKQENRFKINAKKFTGNSRIRNFG